MREERSEYGEALAKGWLAMEGMARECGVRPLSQFAAEDASLMTEASEREDRAGSKRSPERLSGAGGPTAVWHDPSACLASVRGLQTYLQSLGEPFIVAKVLQYTVKVPVESLQWDLRVLERLLEQAARSGERVRIELGE